MFVSVREGLGCLAEVQSQPDLQGCGVLAWLNGRSVLGAHQNTLKRLLLDVSGEWVTLESCALPATCRAMLRLSDTSALVELNTLPWSSVMVWRAGEPLQAVESVHTGLERVVVLDGGHVLYWGGGVQATEVRVASLDGAWRADTTHPRAVRCVGQSLDRSMTISVDAGGLMLRWSGNPLRPRFWCALEPVAVPSERAILANAVVDPVRRLFFCSVRSRDAEAWIIGPGLDDAGKVWRSKELQQVVPLAAHPWGALAQDLLGGWHVMDLRELQADP